MPYIGKQPEHGRFAKVDQINSGFNGSAVTFNLTVDSVAVYPTNPQNLIISIGGVIQQPGTDYTVSAATLTLTSAPASSTDFFGILLGDVLDIGTPSDGSVTVSKMAANSVDSAQYVDGSIDLVHMSADSVDSNQYVDASIDTAHIGNLQITNALMADDAVGVAELSATGTASSSTFLRGDNAWAAAGGGAVVREGGDTSEGSAATTSRSTIMTMATQDIAATELVLITVSLRKGTGAANATAAFLTINGTELNTGEGPGGDDAPWTSSTTNQNEDGSLTIFIAPRAANYLGGVNCYAHVIQSGATPGTALKRYHSDRIIASNPIPNATITTIGIDGLSDNVAITFYANYGHVYSFGAS